MPSLYIAPGDEPLGGPSGAESPKTRFDLTDYHKVSDDIKSDWNLAGTVGDTRLLFRVGYLVANGDAFPQWKPGTEFKALRDSAMAGR